jgi:hypothetical protein
MFVSLWGKQQNRGQDTEHKVMGNLINDLNKLVNTIQKIDKLLTDKPKPKRNSKKTK